jgi:hypothetical protein
MAAEESGTLFPGLGSPSPRKNSYFSLLTQHAGGRNQAKKSALVVTNRFQFPVEVGSICYSPVLFEKDQAFPF